MQMWAPTPLCTTSSQVGPARASATPPLGLEMTQWAPPGAAPSPCVTVPPSAGNEEKNFHLQPDGRLLVLRDLDREREAVFSFIVKASSNRSWTPPRGPSLALDLVTDLTLQEVRVVLEDINDQPPRFTKAEYTAGAGTEPGHGVWGGLCSATYTHLPIPAGVATDAKVGSELIQVLALDADIGNNSLIFYSILAIHYFHTLANDSEDVGQVFTMGRGLQSRPPSLQRLWSGGDGVCVGATGYG